MNELRDALIESFKSDTFFEIVYAQYLEEKDDGSALAAELAALHNETTIDVVDAFAELKNNPDSKMDFFSICHVFEKVLPHLTAPVTPVLSCVHGLYRQFGHDLAAGSLVDAFVAFCQRDSCRPRDALEEIEQNPEYLDFLAPTLIAGSRIDSTHYLTQALQLAGSETIEVRRRALFSLASITWPKCETATEPAYGFFEKTLTEDDDDELLASTVKAAFSLLQHDNSQEGRIEQIIDGALSKGDRYTLHAASHVFGFHTGDLTDRLLNILLSNLNRVGKANQGTINNIDHGISGLLKNDATRATEYLESILLTSVDNLSLEMFGSVLSRIRSNKALVNKLGTRWLISGERVLCEAVCTIVGGGYGANLPIEVDVSELGPNKEKQLVFLARKAIGHLFFNPISAANLTISLMHETRDADVVEEIGGLLADPLLLNFTGKAQEYVAERAANESGIVKKTLD